MRRHRATLRVLLLFLACSCAEEHALSRVTRQACGQFKFQCSNGQCIDSTNVCDGTVDCADRSDENQVTCQTARCPEISFRCSYGACVDADSKCDGKQDCADNSDELLADCPNVQKPATGTCPPRKFHCGSGECIDDFLLCDGTKDCQDGSDETLLQCSIQRCPSAFFRCAYGACVEKTAQCDGTIQCEGDGSDEAFELCGGSTTVPKCTLPFKQDNGGYNVVGCDPKTCSPGSQVPNGAELQFFCNEGYHLSGLSFSYCLNKTFTPSPPVCEKTRCPPLVHESLNIRCYNSNRQKVPCDKPMSIGTKAELACKSNFIKTVEFNYPDLTCTSNGTWDNQPFTCVPECGKPIPKGQTYVLNGVVVKAGDFPWQIGIFLNKNDTYQQICGGAIIKRRLILTAAHCFENSVQPDVYKVAAGKFHRSWDTVDGPEQRFDVERIVVKDTYEGATRNYADDIAVMILKTEVNITDFVRPICVDVNNQYVNLQLSVGINGSIAGWGYTENNVQSEELLTTNLPYVDFRQCYDQLPVSFRPYFTSDKFCAGFISGSGVCRGDSGGALAFEQEVTATTKQWFAQGIVSLGVPSRKSGELCSRQRALFTRVSNHMEWLKMYYNQY